MSCQILNHFRPVWADVAALSTFARYAMTGPLWLEAIGLSASFAPCGPPMMCWNHTPTLSPALAETTVAEVVPAAPQVIELLVTSYTGLLVGGARKATSEPWAAPLTESFWMSISCRQSMAWHCKLSPTGAQGAAHLENAVRFDGCAQRCDGEDRELHLTIQ